jgi:hypothetical protein
MRLGKMLSVGEVVEQPPVKEPVSARPEPARRDTAPAGDSQAEVPAGAPTRG